jgi:hypothetical protein
METATGTLARDLEGYNPNRKIAASLCSGAEFKMALDDPAAGNWCNLSWTQWQQLEAGFVRASAPVTSGIYRIRRAGVAKRLTYIGQTGRSLRERLLALANGTHAKQCPFNDPHTAAPHLWLMVRFDKAQLEFSCAPVNR